MELVSLYIHKFKGASDTLINFSDSIECIKEGNTLHLQKVTCKNERFFKNKYYENQKIKVLLGKNASGKTSVLDFLCSLNSYLESPNSFAIFQSGNDLFIKSTYDYDIYYDGSFSHLYIVKSDFNFCADIIKVSNIFEGLPIHNFSDDYDKYIDLTTSYLVSSISKKKWSEKDVQLNFAMSEHYYKIFGYEPTYQFNIKKVNTNDLKQAFQTKQTNEVRSIAESNKLLKSYFTATESSTFAVYARSKLYVSYPEVEQIHISIYISLFKAFISQSFYKVGLPKYIHDDFFFYALLVVVNNGFSEFTIAFEKLLFKVLEKFMPDKVVKKKFRFIIEKYEIFYNSTLKLSYLLSSYEEYFSDSDFLSVDYIDEFYLSFETSPDYSTSIIEIIEDINEIADNSIYYKWSRLSSGQLAKLQIFSRIFHGLNNVKNEDVILLLDEPDLYLHPEWQATFIKELITIMSSFSDKRIQVIIATHSPVLVSDVLNKDIISLSKRENGQVIVENKYGFGSTIASLYLDTLETESPFGELSRDHMKRLFDKSYDNDEKSFYEFLIDNIPDKKFREFLRVKND